MVISVRRPQSVERNDSELKMFTVALTKACSFTHRLLAFSDVEKKHLIITITTNYV